MYVYIIQFHPFPNGKVTLQENGHIFYLKAMRTFHSRSNQIDVADTYYIVTASVRSVTSVSIEKNYTYIVGQV